MIEQVKEYELQEDNQRGEAKETDRADKQFAKLERENRLLEKKSEDYPVSFLSTDIIANSPSPRIR